MSSAEGRTFPSTRWSQVEAAGSESQLGDRPLLGQLLERYLPALQAHLLGRRWRMSADQADDLLQGFVLKKVIERQLVARADRSRGKFRTFLLTALDHYVLDELERKQLPEVAYEEETSDPQVSPADAFEQTWVRIVLDEVIGRMHAECEAEGQAEIWGVFECRLLNPALDLAEPPAYREIVRRLGFQSPIQAANALTTAKRNFRRILELVIAEYAADGQVDEEIAELRRILARGA